ncbi:hypothetical protein C922_04657 [Plasmodium inui San Antonio 1]|uniref:Uncharacterized protein n=1 Tax=Plasmodium inui San Antonio 1 TaxID=1237626 RepID=W7A043_9APIC|nr:hypothetical protein C922_04657 [Plasmodium inui San Antonio 1]EUD64925.1 hypothetical protein C922_04657 [Plasmodium inui San Antonio 1]
MGFKLEQYIHQKIWKTAIQDEKNSRSPEQHTIWELESEARDKGNNIDRDRWKKLATKQGRSLLQVDLRAKLLCQALEIWMTNLEETSEGIWEGERVTCDVDSLGFLGGRWKENSCPITHGNNSWARLTGDKPLTRKQPYQRNLAVCMDMMSIILGIYDNITREGDGWKVNSEDACLRLSEELTAWAGKATSDEIMSSWFNNMNPKQRETDNIPIRTRKNKAELWEPFFKKLGTYVISLVCYKDPDTNSWDTTCVVTKKSRNCEHQSGVETPEEYQKVSMSRGLSKGLMLSQKNNLSPLRAPGTRLKAEQLNEELNLLKDQIGRSEERTQEENVIKDLQKASTLMSKELDQGKTGIGNYIVGGAVGVMILSLGLMSRIFIRRRRRGGIRSRIKSTTFDKFSKQRSGIKQEGNLPRPKRETEQKERTGNADTGPRNRNQGTPGPYERKILMDQNGNFED